MTSYETEQENFWSGQFGNEYVERNRSEAILASKTATFVKMLSKFGGGETYDGFRTGS